MKVFDTEIEGVKIVEPQKFGDARGFFVETYNAERYKAAGIMVDFVQDNMSLSHKGVIRGLHWQVAPHTQSKLVWVVQGAVWDVAVDVRMGSPTFGKHVAVTLSAENGRQFFIPQGFAHGFVSLEDNTLFCYKCDNFYCPSAERGVLFDDQTLKIKWPELDVPLELTEKDKRYLKLKELQVCDLLANLSWNEERDDGRSYKFI